MVLAVQCVSGRIWEFPMTLIATEPQVDDVILIEATELGKTSAVGFRLTSTTRCVVFFAQRNNNIESTCSPLYLL